MTGPQWTTGRQQVELTQVEAAKALGISQPYLSQLESGQRVAASALARRATSLYHLSPTALPFAEAETVKAVDLQQELAGLGYPEFAHVSPEEKRNPAQVLLNAVVQRDLETRLVEALPWVMNQYPDLDWPWLRDRVKLRNAQNRLGYLVFLAKEVSGGDVLSTWEQDLEEARLAREGTLCRDSMPQAERTWLKSHRPAAAEHWNLLTGLTPEQLPYASRRF
jgi:transcriptional regulator with XRE-family HTH domain